MERTKNILTPKEGEIHWKKVGGGSFRIGNRIIKPGQTFLAFPHEIPKAFRDVVIALDGGAIFEEDKKKKKETVKPSDVKKPTFVVEKRKGSQWWDVFNVQKVEGKEVKKKINDKGLPKEKADALKEDLEK